MEKGSSTRFYLLWSFSKYNRNQNLLIIQKIMCQKTVTIYFGKKSSKRLKNMAAVIFS